jgi:endonuclease/exonuclease/phosphatase family metal-dependent hydrolase
MLPGSLKNKIIDNSKIPIKLHNHYGKEKKLRIKAAMRKILCCVFLFFTAASWISRPLAANPKPKSTLLCMWWNVENLFDPYNDPATDDDDFTPGGRLQWTEKKLTLKQMRIRHLLSAVEVHPDYRKFPDIVAFAEVENRRLFEKTLSGIQEIKYKTIYYESSDPRGIDIGLGYNSLTLRPIASKAYSIPLEGKPTRKIIVAEFSTARHPFHIILNHWPSRSFDTQWSEPKRLVAAKVVRHILDSLLLGKPKADIIVMGDFNDEPGNRSLKQVLGSSFDAAKVRTNGNRLLYNCWSGYHGIGSYSYHNKWQQIDQILLSSGMLDNKGLSAFPDAFRCFSFSRMLDYSGRKPWSTYEKRKYQGGYSDHLPLLLKIDILP